VTASRALRLRAATLADLDAILAVKAALPLRPDGRGESSRGGFLLGTSRERYAALITGARTRVLVDAGAVVGFAAALPDAALRASPLWQRRAQIDPGERRELLAAVDALPVGYLDQLAVSPDPKYMLCATVLAYAAVAGLFAEGCALVFTTVVARPVRNLASRRLLDAVGALHVGTLGEDYPEVGAVTSDVFAVPAAALDPGAQDDARRRSRLQRLAALSRRLADE
jgi:hypothetical protein